jgi:cellulose synthase (UDP-forming)
MTLPEIKIERRLSENVIGIAGRRHSDGIYFLNSEGVSRPLLILNIILALIYFAFLAFWFPRGNIYLFYFLLFGEIYHIWQILSFIHTIWDPEIPKMEFNKNFNSAVDIFITVCGEPLDIIEQTVRAAQAIDYKNFNIYILNDGFVRQKENWHEVQLLADRLGVECITRRLPGGAKAGNINHALLHTRSPFVAIFDADHIPHKDFLKEMMGYFSDSKVGFAQSPQFYRNRNFNYVTAGAWEQQELFFGTICPGKQKMNANFMCGTNMVIRRVTLEEVGGIYEKSITEDFLSSLFIHERGWKSVYVPKVLAEGLAPEDFLSYTKQQFRWARGSLDLIIKHNPLFRKGLTFSQKIQYLSSSSFYLSGLIVLMNAIFPLIFFFTGAVPFVFSTMVLASIFLPYIFLSVYILRRSTGYNYTYRAVAFSMGAFMIHIQAFLATILGFKNNFIITPKNKQEGNFISLIIPHIIYILFVAIGLTYAVAREGFNASVGANLCWALFNIAVFLPYMMAAIPSWSIETEKSSGQVAIRKS